MTDEKKPTTEDEMESTLLAFKKEAEGAIQAFRLITTDIEKRLTDRVQARAVEQSAAMQSTEERIASCHERLSDYVGHFGRITATMELVCVKIKDHEQEIGNLRELVNDAIATCKHLDDKAGDRFGKKLDALATQVAALTTIGERLAATEKRAKDAVAEAYCALAGLREREDDIDGLENRIESLEHKAADEALAAAEAETDTTAKVKKG